MKKIFSITLLVFVVHFTHAQLTAHSIIGNHAGFNNWEKLPVTIELKQNFNYELKTYNYELVSEKAVKGTWRIEGEDIILTDVVGGQTILRKFTEGFYLVAENGVTCVARFYQDEALEEFWKKFISVSRGC